jgi:predicted CXXCH cytochrome family protein
LVDKTQLCEARPCLSSEITTTTTNLFSECQKKLHGDALRGRLSWMPIRDTQIALLAVLFVMTGGLRAGAAEPGYAGSESCRPCHEGSFAAWQGSDHDRAMMPVTEPGAVLGDFSNVRKRFGEVEARFFRAGEAYRVEISEADGTRRTVEVLHAFGVDPLQQYLVSTSKGRLQALTLAWDSRLPTEGGQRWMSLQTEGEAAPGDLLHWEGNAFRWNQMCADCHSTALRKRYQVASDSYATTYTDVDVGCEACHGPGAEHIRRAEKGVADGPSGLSLSLIGRGAWVPEEGGPRKMATATAAPLAVPEIEVCAPCHARRSLIGDPIASHGKFLDAYRPELLEAGLYQLDGQILDEVYVYGSFLQSKMFAAGVSCSDCHEPHSLELRAEGNGLCVNCHNAAVFDAQAHHFHAPGSPGAQCISCHMPERTYMSVDGRRDHGFRVPRPRLAHELGTSLVCLDCHTDRDARWADVALTERGKQPKPGKTFPRAFAASRTGDPRAPALLARVLAQPSESGIARGTAAQLLGRHPGPEARRGLRQAAGDADPLVRLGVASALQTLPAAERFALGVPLLSDPRLAVRIEAGRALADLPEANFSALDRQALRAAQASYRQAQMAQADWPQSHVNLGMLEARRGNLPEARAHYEQSIRTGPDFVPGYVNLADTLRLEQKEAEATEVLRAGLAKAPGHPDLRHALGLSLVRQGDPAAALTELRQASLAAPENARYIYVYAVALHSAGDGSSARAIVQEGLLRHPADPMLLPLALSLSLEQNDRASARAYARQLLVLDPQNTAVAQLVRRLED